MDADEISLIGEDGVEHSFRLHDVFEMDGAAYYLVEAVDDPEQVLLLKEVRGSLESIEGEELARVLARLENEEDE